MTVRQAGGIVLLGNRVVLRHTSKDEYLFPKGHIEPGETLEQTAVREVEEETGLEAVIVADVGETSFTYAGEEYRVNLFLMRATRQSMQWDDHLGKDVVTVPLERARETLSFEGYREAMDRALAIVRAGGSGVG